MRVRHLGEAESHVIVKNAMLAGSMDLFFDAKSFYQTWREEMKRQFTETMEIVERILKAHSGTRDSDKALILEYMLSHTSLKNLSRPAMDALVKAVYTQMPPFETITRCRRKIQEDGRYRGSMGTAQLRKAKAKAMKAMFK